MKNLFADIRVLLAVLLVTLSGQVAMAQTDRVYTNDSTTPTSGQIVQADKNGVKLKTGANEKTFLAGDIRKILYQGDPSELTKGREAALGGNYEDAVEELEGLNVATLPRAAIKADAAYYLLLAKARLALAGRGDKAAAAQAALAFARSNSDSYHFYSVARLLGDLALALNNHDQAILYYGSLKNAPTTEMKVESKYLTGVAQLAKGDVAAADAAFNEVLGLQVNSAAVLRLQKLSQAGRAVALANNGKGDEALKIVNGLIEELSPNDVEMAARIYNAQGASYDAMGDKEGAIMAYLHTHLLFSSQPDAHAQALSRLVELWPQVGRPERVAEARQELEQRYPGYGK
ncbi:tetratricopeptide repeat protein [Stieleria varia]|uniref:Tetratricopeptide repeat protein n=1 Tax=Stieleria varia TaxID=2528005 RepID=A0A5C6B899_9BACT|nr:hypothetical protein [Stieleria varia]TWU07852.1 hypothetical protein Pla52n_04280 [Stieleria varia]